MPRIIIIIFLEYDNMENNKTKMLKILNEVKVREN